ncbi:zonular occludens toxin domain-containing protein [Acinetobacter pittii]|uniref:zonular occludens toxin domain-containing protein n=1 Tax=Acinetobacter pittii TaxID=48296 RepID=UPI00355BB770
MLTLISATPGSGKTLKAVELIYECLNNGYVVYSNILGLNDPSQNNGQYFPLKIT